MTHQFYTLKTFFRNFFFKKVSSLIILFICLFTVNANAQTIGTVSVSGAPVCAGSTISISFVVTNGKGNPKYFTTNTTYIIYYSTGSGYLQFQTFQSSTAPNSSNGSTATITYTITVPANTIPGSNYKISIGSTTPTFDGSTGINASAAFTVNANPTATFTKIFASTCHGGTDGSISVTATGGTSPYSYSWTGVNGFTATTANINNLSLGDYNVVVTDKNLCSTSLTGITIKMAGPLGVGISQASPTCAGNDGSINAFRIGGVYDGITPIQFKLDGDATVPYSTNNTFSGLKAGSYFVTVQDSKGCTASQSVNLLADTRPAPTVGIIQNNSPTCAGNQTDGSISAMRVGGVYDGITPIQFRLGGAATVPYSSNNTFTGLSAGTYFVTVKDSRGCTGITQVVVATDTRPAPSVGLQSTNPGCAGNDGSISAYRVGGVYDGVTSIQFKLDGAATVPYQNSGAFTGLSAGNYTVTVKDSRGCTGSVAVTLTQAAPLAFTPNGYNINVSSCGNGSDGSIVATVSGGVTPYTYSLNGGVQQGVSSLQTFGFSGLLPNTPYTVKVTDSKGCSISESITLSQVAAPTAEVNYTGNATCIGGNQGFITAWHSGGVPGYMYSDDGGTTFQDSYRFLNLAAGNYSVVIKDSKGCISAAVPVTIADGTVTCRMGNRTGTTPESSLETMNKTINPEFNSSLRIQAYPNPSASASDFTLDVQGNSTDRVSITVTDLLGRRLLLVQGNANQQYKLGSNLKAGIYFVQVMQSDNVQTLKIVKE